MPAAGYLRYHDGLEQKQENQDAIIDDVVASMMRINQRVFDKHRHAKRHSDKMPMPRGMAIKMRSWPPGAAAAPASRHPGPVAGEPSDYRLGPRGGVPAAVRYGDYVAKLCAAPPSQNVRAQATDSAAVMRLEVKNSGGVVTSNPVTLSLNSPGIYQFAGPLAVIGGGFPNVSPMDGGVGMGQEARFWGRKGWHWTQPAICMSPTRSTK